MSAHALTSELKIATYFYNVETRRNKMPGFLHFLFMPMYHHNYMLIKN